MMMFTKEFRDVPHEIAVSVVLSHNYVMGFNRKKFHRNPRGTMQLVNIEGYIVDVERSRWDIVLRFQKRSRFIYVFDWSTMRPLYRREIFPCVDFEKLMRKLARWSK